MSNDAITGFRLSIQQERIWSQMSSDGTPFWTECEVSIAGALDSSKLHEAIRGVVQRYEILRTTFHRQPGFTVPFQVILDEPVFAWQVDDLSALQQEEVQRRCDRARVELPLSTDLENGPVLHVHLVKLSDAAYRMLLSLPSLCADTRTMEKLVSEIAGSYGNPSKDAEDVMQYADIAEWQQELVTSAEAKPAIDFWRDYCHNIDFSAAESALNTNVTKSTSELSPASVEVSLVASLPRDPEASEEVLLAAWGAWLSRVLGTSSVSLGFTVNGRRYDELADAFGPFARPLPLWVECSEAKTFAEFAEKVQQVRSDISLWQDGFLWANIRQVSNQESGPMLPIGFDFHRREPARQGTDVTFTRVRESAWSERFLLRLAALEDDGRVALALQFDEGSLDRELVEWWANSFAAFLNAVLSDPSTPIGLLPLLNESQRHEVVSTWNQTTADYPRDVCIHALFEDVAACYPGRAALRFNEQSLTYSQLNESANRIANYLQLRGVGAGALVAICLDRSASVIVSMLGVLKAGAAYVPLSGDHPKTRLLQQLAGVRALITEFRFASLAQEFGGEVLYLDRDEASLAAQSGNNPKSDSNSDTLVYVIYTSGSTGVPKGVAVRHRNLVNYTRFVQERLELTDEQAPLHFATVSTFSADLGNTCIYPALLTGGCLHIIGNEVAADSQRLRDYMRANPVDVLKIVPSHLAALLNAGGGAEVLPRRFLILGGEAFSLALLDKIRATHSPCSVLNHYGPTETTVGSLTLRLADFATHSSIARTIPIGKPIANTRVYVLDRHLNPVPVGVPGELYIAGDGVTAGYLGRPDLTAERFVPEVFAQAPASMMYRTGDLVRYLPDGNVEFLGRVDDQVKIRGFRIELSDIESALSRHPGVEQAAVQVIADERGDKALVGYFVGSASIADLRSFLHDQLPDYMVPATLISIVRIPLNSNGKIDRAALPKPDQIKSADKERIAPRTPSEDVVSSIWAEVLRRDDIGVEDNFFEIGGHSLLATQIAARLREHFKVAVPVRTVFEAPSIAELAKRMDTSRREEQGLLPPPITPGERNGGLPLSYAQERLWVLDQIEPNNPLYNIPRGLRLRGLLRIDALEQALNEIVRRHESQRTSFAVHDGHPVQIVSPELKITLEIRDLSALPEADRESEVLRLAVEESRRPFDLRQLPLLRSTLFRLSSEDHVFLLNMHHIISDAWSAGIFLQEVTALYEAFSAGKASPLPEVTVQYGDYSVQERAWLTGEVLERQLGFWRNQLKGIPSLIDLPLDRERPQPRTFTGACEVFRIPAETVSGVKSLARQDGATLFMALMALFQAMLFKYSGSDQIVVGTDLANRTMPQTEGMIGFFINLLAIRTDLSGDPTFRELLARVREGLLESYAHQEVPFPKIVHEVQPERSSTHNPIVQVLFVMQNTPRARRELAGLKVEPFEIPITTSKFDMALFVSDGVDGLTAYWVYSTELFDAASIQRMWRHYCALLAIAVASPDARLSTLSMFTAEEIAAREKERAQRKLSQFSKLKATSPSAIGLKTSDAETPA